MKLQSTFAALLSTLMLGACANMSALQTAETLKPGEGEFTVGAGYVNHKAIGNEDSEATAPYMEFQYRRGIAEKFDAGAKVTLIGTAGIDAKYQLIDNPTWDLAIGTSLAYLTISSGGTVDGNGDISGETKSTIIDWTIPVYISAQVSDGLALYTSPKYMLRTGAGDALSVLGATVGAKWGQTSGLMLETTYGKGLGSDFQTLQFNAAFFMKGDAWL